MAALIVGADIGNGNVKITSKYKNFSFKTACRLENNEGFTDGDYILYDNTRWLVGKGNSPSTNNKARDDVFHTCFLYSLSSFSESNFKVVVGLPVSYYKTYKDMLEEKYNGKQFNVKIENKSGCYSKTINIEEMKVVPEGILCLEDKSSDNLLIDIGSNTVDVAYFEEGKLSKALSYPLGIKTMYSFIANELKKLGSDCSSDKVEDYIRRGSYILNGNIIPFDPSAYKKAHFKDILSNIRNDFPWNSTTKTFVGGGSIALMDVISEEKCKVVDNPTYCNSKVFFEFGERLWKR